MEEIEGQAMTEESPTQNDKEMLEQRKIAFTKFLSLFFSYSPQGHSDFVDLFMYLLMKRFHQSRFGRAQAQFNAILAYSQARLLFDRGFRLNQHEKDHHQFDGIVLHDIRGRLPFLEWEYELLDGRTLEEMDWRWGRAEKALAALWDNPDLTFHSPEQGSATGESPVSHDGGDT